MAMIAAFILPIVILVWYFHLCYGTPDKEQNLKNQQDLLGNPYLASVKIVEMVTTNNNSPAFGENFFTELDGYCSKLDTKIHCDMSNFLNK